jgi:chromosomal replication initiation ATPase DnaA
VTPIDLDPRFTFESFVIGTANRLASAAARRVAEAPGATYNPLFIYSASGLGKTHLVSAIGHHTGRLLPALVVRYHTLEQFMDEVMTAIEAGERDSFRLQLGKTGLLILDDVQFLAGRHRTQEELLRAWDIVSANGGQVVLTSDRPPQEIDGLDERLLSRFSGGLIVDMGAPDYETRVAITRRKAEERGQTLTAGVAETLARIAFGNVRELQGALNRLIAVQELEGRAVAAEEVSKLLGRMANPTHLDEFGSFLAEIADTIDAVVTESPAEGQLASAILRWQGEGYATRSLEAALAEPAALESVETHIRQYEAGVERLREIVSEIAALDPKAIELGRRELLRDPDRLEEAESLLGDVRARCRPLTSPPAEHTFTSLSLPEGLLALRAAMAVAERPGEQYNPIYIHGPAGSGKTALLAAIGNRSLEFSPNEVVAFIDGRRFAMELIEALEHNRVEGWRVRYRRARIFLLDGVDALADTEMAQDELFHLFDALQRAGAQLAFTASCPPGELTGIADRLRSRLEAGLVVVLPERAVETDGAEAAGVGGGGTADDGARAAGAGGAAEGGIGDGVAAGGADPSMAGAGVGGIAGVREEEASRLDPWFLDREKVVWDWPYLEDVIVQDWA